MDRYCFILGKNPLLSLAEIFNLADYFRINLRLIDLTHEIMVVEADGFSPEKWQARLGGTVKIAGLDGCFSKINEALDWLSQENQLENLLAGGKNKVVFGFSLYGEAPRRKKEAFRTLGMKIKKSLRASGRPGRLVMAADGALSSVQVNKNKMIENGAEIIIAGGIHEIYAGRTLTVQDFEDYSRRDYGRPGRDPKSGMLPPKLAKILINLAKPRPDDLIADPFCGSGTIVQEALMMGYRRIFGGDLSAKAVADTKKNMGWLYEKYGLKEKEVKIQLSDAKELKKIFAADSIDAVITEPYLGPPLKPSVSVVEMLAIIQELENLYLRVFGVWREITKPDATIAIIFPLFSTSHGIYSLKILEQLEQLGFCRINPFPDSVSLFARVGPTARGSLVYSRPGQLIQREIFIFRNNKKAET